MQIGLSPFLLKLISLVCIFLVCLLGGVVPIQLAGWFKDQSSTISYANCLSGGVLIGASLVHLLMDAEDVSFEYPLAHLCCGIGFFAAFILEKVLFSHKHEGGGVDGVELSNLVSREVPPNPSEEEDVGGVLSLGEKEDGQEAPMIDGGPPKEGERVLHSGLNHSPGYILFSVLSLEAFISGSALGFSSTSLGVFVLFVAVVTHIWAEAFALCANFLKTKMEKRKLYRWILVFSSITPLGIFFGMVLESTLQGRVARVISSVLISFAAGTFLYIAVVEVIVEEFEDGKNKWQKLNLLLLGFAFMSALAVWL